MAIPALLDYEYQYRDDGVKLNSSSVVPFVDVESITGLDMSEIDLTEVDIDGQHGGVINAEYFKTRTIVIDCTIYADPANVDVFMDTLISNFVPNGTQPFYFKGAGVGIRLIYAKSLGIKYNIDTLRRTGSCKAQIILKAADPLKYVETTTTLTNNTYFTANNVGNMPTRPIFDIRSGTHNSITLRNNTTGKQIIIPRQAVLGDIMVVDFNTKTITTNGIRNSSILGTGVVDWWELIRGNNSIRFVSAGTTGYTVPVVSVVWRSGWA